MTKIAATLLAVIALGLGLAPAATAQEGASLEVYPTEVRPGAIFGTGIRGVCETYSDVTSDGFAAPVQLAGNPDELWATGDAVRTPGTYTVTATCDSEVLTTTFTVLPHQPPSWWLSPIDVQPGGEIWGGSDIISGCPGGPVGPVTSPGFAAPLQFTTGGNFGRFSGKTTAYATPGTYTATLQCAGDADHRHAALHGGHAADPARCVPQAAVGRLAAHSPRTFPCRLTGSFPEQNLFASRVLAAAHCETRQAWPDKVSEPRNDDVQPDSSSRRDIKPSISAHRRCSRSRSGTRESPTNSSNVAISYATSASCRNGRYSGSVPVPWQDAHERAAWPVKRQVSSIVARRVERRDVGDGSSSGAMFQATDSRQHPASSIELFITRRTLLSDPHMKGVATRPFTPSCGKLTRP